MSLKIKYIFFIGCLHLALIILIYFLLKEHIWYFIGSEFLIILSLYFSYSLYKSFIKPVELLQSGTDAIADKDFSVKYIKTGSKEIDNLIHVYNNMIEQLREERTLISEQSHFINKLIELTPMGIIILDYDGNVSKINPSAHRILNLDKNVLSKNLDDIRSPILNEIKSNEIGQSQLISINGIDKFKCQINDVIHQGFKRKIILIDDLSEELLQSEKRAYGQIIRMMAHEVNNSIGAINSILDSVVEFGFEDEKDADLRNSLIIAKKRNLSLSSFMANYASILRLPKAQLKPMNLSHLLKKCGQLFLAQANENGIQIKFNIPIEEVNIHGDSILLEQAVSNILKNAIEAIKDEGEIIISCNKNPIGFSISDNGEGITKGVSQNLFTPFFSTKATGQGVGLMLIREILEQHKAKFSLSTDQNDGRTYFNVEF